MAAVAVIATMRGYQRGRHRHDRLLGVERELRGDEECGESDAASASARPVRIRSAASGAVDGEQHEQQRVEPRGTMSSGNPR